MILSSSYKAKKSLLLKKFVNQINAWKIQAEKSQRTLVDKEKEWKKINRENLKKIEKLYKQLNDSEESNQKNIHKINNLTKTIGDDKKIIQHQNEHTIIIESNFNDSLVAKDQKIQELLNEVSNLKTQIITFETKENSLAESQEKLDKKFNQLLETINSKE